MCRKELAIAIVVELDGHQAPVETAGPLDDGVDGPRERVATWPHDASLVTSGRGGRGVTSSRGSTGTSRAPAVTRRAASPRAPHWPRESQAPRRSRRTRVARRS